MNVPIARRALASVCLAGAMLAVTTGHAEEGATPVLVSTSVDSGFSGQGAIAARFDRTLDASLSTGALRDKDGAEVTSTVIRTSSGMGADGDSLVLSPSYAQLSESLSPYTVTFTAVAATTGTPGPAAAVSKQFTYDLERPEAVITDPSDPRNPRVVAPGESLALSGHAFDRFSYDTTGATPVARVGNRSGLDRVEIRYYRLDPSARPPAVAPGPPPVVTLPVVQPSQEVTGLRHDAALAACTRADACVDGEKAWTANTGGLTSGSWTARATAIDVAGNRSTVAETSFIVL